MRKVTIIATFMFCALQASAQNWMPLDKGFKQGGVVHLLADTINNCIYASGNIPYDGWGNPFKGIAKWNSNKWDTLGSAHVGSGSKHALSYYKDTLLVSGTFYNGIWKNQIAKFNGVGWDSISLSPESSVNCFVEDNAELYMCGTFLTCGGDSTQSLGKYDGTTFTALTSIYKPGQIMRSLIFFNDTLYVGGNFHFQPNYNIAILAKWDGTNLLAVDPQFQGSTIIESMVIYKNELYIGGEFYKSQGYSGNCIMKYDGHTFSDVGNGTDYRVRSMKVHNGILYVGGWFTTAGGQVSKGIAAWDGTSWYSLNTNDFSPSDGVQVIEVFNNELYVGGWFRKIGSDSIDAVAKWNHALGIENHQQESICNITIYPNPASNELSIKLNKPLENDANISVFNMLGEEVYKVVTSDGSAAADGATGEVKIDIAKLPAGMYFVRMSDAGCRIYSGRFVKE